MQAYNLSGSPGQTNEWIKVLFVQPLFVVHSPPKKKTFAVSSLGRLARSSLMTFEPRNVMEQLEHVAQLNRDAFGSRNWTTAHVRLGEMQVRFALSVHISIHQWCKSQQKSDRMSFIFTL